MAINEYDFHYVPAEGKLSGLQFQKQTEDALNDMGNRIITGAEADSAEALEKANQALAASANAVETANNADTKAQNALDAVASVPVVHFVKVNSTDSTDSNYNGGGATGADSIAIGVSASVSAGNSVSIGTQSEANDENAVSIGTQAIANDISAIAIGESASAEEADTIAIGSNANANSDGSIAIGRYAYAESTSSGANSIAIGDDAASHGDNSIAIGNGEIEVSGDNSVVIGNNAQASGDNCIVIGVGNRSTMSYDDSIAIGHADVQAKSGIALGYGNVLQNANNGIAIGGAYNENVGEDDSTYAKKENAIAIGKGAVADGNNSVAIGSDSVTSASDEFSIGKPASGNDAEYKRKITHVADGVNNSDAATVGQINSAYTAGNGIDITSGVVSVKPKTDSGIDVDSNGVAVKLEANKGLDVGSNGLSVKIESNKGIEVSANGIAVKAGSHITLTSNGVNVDDTGTVTSGNTKLVTGGTVFGAVVPIQNNAGYHNSIFRGKNLGDTLTEAQSAAIQAETFDDLFIGDYWEKTIQFTYYSAATDLTAVAGKTYYADTAGTTLEEQPAEGTDISEAGYCVANNVNASFKFRIADFNYYYNIGDTNFTTPHIVIVPDTQLYSAQMHITNTGGYVAGAANTTEGGYMATDLFKGLVAAENAFIAMFGAEHIPSHRVMLPTTCTGGRYTGWGWQSRKADILTEQQVYGARAWGAPANNGYSIASQKTQLSLFKLNPASINNRQHYWLQDVYSSASFCLVNADGGANGYYASYSIGVRPLSLVI